MSLPKGDGCSVPHLYIQEKGYLQHAKALSGSKDNEYDNGHVEVHKDLPLRFRWPPRSLSLTFPQSSAPITDNTIDFFLDL